MAQTVLVFKKMSFCMICPAQLDLNHEAGGFPLAPSLLKTDTLPVHHPTAEGGDTSETTKV